MTPPNVARRADVVLCANTGCPRAAISGGRCVDHQGSRAFGDDSVQTVDLSKADIARIRAEVEADAAVLFPVALGIAISHNLQQLGPHVSAALVVEPRPDPQVTCPECGGYGYRDEGRTRRCPTCHGEGTVDNWALRQ